jgi:hypothetical protein
MRSAAQSVFDTPYDTVGAAEAARILRIPIYRLWELVVQGRLVRTGEAPHHFERQQVEELAAELSEARRTLKRAGRLPYQLEATLRLLHGWNGGHATLAEISEALGHTNRKTTDDRLSRLRAMDYLQRASVGRRVEWALTEAGRRYIQEWGDPVLTLVQPG